MIEGLITGLLLILVLALDLVLVAARASFLQSSPTRLMANSHSDERDINRAVEALTYLLKVRASLNLMLVCTRFAIAGLIFWYFSIHSPVQNLWLRISIIIVSALLLFWLEWGAERIVSSNPESWVLRLLNFVSVLAPITSVLLIPWSLSKEAKIPSSAPGPLTEDELKTLVGAGQEEGIFEKGERRMIYSIFQLGDTLAREIMIPRIDMLALDVRTTLPVAIEALLRSGHSRVPVYEDSVDNMLGLLYAKDLLRIWQEGSKIKDLHSLLREAYFVPEAKKVDELLRDMQAHRIHMAIVVDEYGGIAGLVTLEDIVEEIVGEIQDEYDQAEEAPYQELSDGGFLFLGRIDLDDFNEIVGSDLPTDEADTLGGYIYSKLGRVPAVGEKLHHDNLLLTVEQVSARRIRKVRASMRKRIPESENNHEDHHR